MKSFSLVTLGLCFSFLLLTPKKEEDKPNRLPPEALAVLEKAEELELWSLDPGTGRPDAADGFRGWKTLGKTTVKKAETRKSLVASLEKGIAENEGRVAECFIPRHGLRASAGGKTVDLVICFECLRIQAIVGDKHHFLRTMGSPQPAFDQVLRDAKVPLPPKKGQE
jgi:hypothetical protein